MRLGQSAAGEAKFEGLLVVKAKLFVVAFAVLLFITELLGGLKRVRTRGVCSYTA
jgi:hypothetical protein